MWRLPLWRGYESALSSQSRRSQQQSRLRLCRRDHRRAVPEPLRREGQVVGASRHRRLERPPQARPPHRRRSRQLRKRDLCAVAGAVRKVLGAARGWVELGFLTSPLWGGRKIRRIFRVGERCGAASPHPKRYALRPPHKGEVKSFQARHHTVFPPAPSGPARSVRDLLGYALGSRRRVRAARMCSGRERTGSGCRAAHRLSTCANFFRVTRVQPRPSSCQPAALAWNSSSQTAHACAHGTAACAMEHALRRCGSRASSRTSGVTRAWIKESRF